MRNPLKPIARALVGPIWRPVASRAYAAMVRAAREAARAEVHPHTGELLVGVAVARREVGTYRNETNLCLDALVREVTRLQDEVADLRGTLADLAATRAEFAVIPPLAESA